jgi:hypothetical protein
MTKLMHSLPWTIALTLAAQAGEAEATPFPDTTTGTTQESSLDVRDVDDGIQESQVENAESDQSSDPVLYARIKKSLEM